MPGRGSFGTVGTLCIVRLLRQVEVLHGQGLSMAHAIRRVGISEVTFYRWRKEYAGMNGAQLRRLKALEKENERLRRAVSDLALDKQMGVDLKLTSSISSM